MSGTEPEQYPMELPCPMCSSENTDAMQQAMDIPNFPGHFLFTFKCNDCKFRHSDFFSVEHRTPLHYSYEAEGKNGWTTKIIRSSSGTISVPSINAKIEPGPGSEGRITNIEGVLIDIREKIRFLVRNADDDESRAKASETVLIIDDLIRGFGKILVIVEDPYGNSLILPNDESKLVQRKLSQEEAEKLKTGYFEFGS